MAEAARHEATPTPLPATEAGLIAAARRGDESAVRALIRANNQRLFRVARAVLRNDGEAEDVVQETYVSAFTQLESFRGDAAFSTWLTRIALNAALGRKRRQKETIDMDAFEASEAAGGAQVIMFPGGEPAANPEEEAARRQASALLEAAIGTLPEPFRLVFVMREIEEMSAEETGALLGVKPQTVKTRLHRARRLLRQEIEARLAPGLGAVFPFDGARCAGMADKAIARLQAEGALA